jgi:hypothetical protein
MENAPAMRPSVLTPAEARALGQCQRCPSPAPGVVVARRADEHQWHRLVLCRECRDLGRRTGSVLLEVISGGLSAGSPPHLRLIESESSPA